MSSELAAYDSINYGLWYDDAQFARVAFNARPGGAATLKVKRIVIGECGHAHKALCVIADRILGGDLEYSAAKLPDAAARHRPERQDSTSIPRRNDFPVTLHDPCNIVRLMGVVEPQREVLRAICSAVPRNGAARRRQLLLRRRQRIRHHERPQLPGLALSRFRAARSSSKC